MADRILPKDFYVYVHRKATTGDIFYVGKGHGKRAWSNRRSKHWRNVVNKHGLVVEIVQDGLQEWYSFELECEMILFYGRENLVNMTDGGEGPSGCIPSDETREKMSFAIKAALAKPGVKEKHRGATCAAMAKPEYKEKHSAALARPEIKEKMRAATRAAYAKPEVKEKHRAAIHNQIKVKPILCVETGIVFQTSYCAQTWLRQTNRKAAANKVYLCAQGNRGSAYGYTWKYTEQNPTQIHSM